MLTGNVIKVVTEQKQSSEYARSLIEASLDPFVTISAEGKVTDVNNATEKVTGYTRKELVGSDFSDYFTEPDKAREGYQLVYENGFVTDYPLAIKHKNGYVTDVLYNASVYRNQLGEVEGVFAAARDVTEQKQASEYARSLIEASLDPLVTISAEGKITDVNNATEKVTGYTRKELVGSDFSDYFTEPDKAREGYELAFSQSFVRDYPLAIRHTSGRITDVLYNASVYKDDSGNIIGVFAAARDVTKQKQTEQLKLAATVFTHAREGIMITDANEVIIDVNDTLIMMTGYTRDEFIGQNTSILQSGEDLPEFHTVMWQNILEKGYWAGEVWNRRKNGEIYAEMKTISVVHDAEGLLQNYVVLCTDITSAKKHQAQLERIAHYDVLTDLPNRTLLADRLSQSMLKSDRKNTSLAVAFLDLDNFKAVNDTHGHHTGDELLIIVSRRMQDALRETDMLARIGGDEFIVVLAGLEKVKDCEPVLERLLRAGSEPVVIGKLVLQVSTSIGVALYPQDDADADMLMRHADQAMYIAKQAGKNRYHLFDTKEDNTIKNRRKTISGIYSALERCEFVLHYQPKVNMKTGEVVGVEALIRWQHPERGLVPPLVFLPGIEGHAISLKLGEWVIDTALSQISQWRNIGVKLPVSVNISGYQLQQGNFATRLAALLEAHHDVKPHYLELEILETSALSDIDQVSATMKACHDLGVRFALDDFGTGYSSLTHLRRLPAHLIKIDQSFVRDMLKDADDLAIIEGVIGLAKAFQRDVIAEGVETIDHGVALLQLGCELAQGYGIAKPMPASDIPEWVSSWKADDFWLAKGRVEADLNRTLSLVTATTDPLLSVAE